VAHTHGLEELKAWCAEVLANRLTADNYLQLLNMAELYGIRLLKVAVLKFIALNVHRLTA
jgi:hypothetical protein